MMNQNVAGDTEHHTECTQCH